MFSRVDVVLEQARFQHGRLAGGVHRQLGRGPNHNPHHGRARAPGQPAQPLFLHDIRKGMPCPSVPVLHVCPYQSGVCLYALCNMAEGEVPRPRGPSRYTSRQVNVYIHVSGVTEASDGVEVFSCVHRSFTFHERAS